MKRLLHIGCNVGTESLPKAFRKATNYDEIPLNHNTAAALRALNYTPDIVFLQIQNDTISSFNTCNFIGQEIKKLRDQGAFIINWTGDKRDQLPRWMIEFHNFVSITAFSNRSDVIEARKYGMKSAFLQQGIDTGIYSRDPVIEKTKDIVFFANNYGNQFPLSKYRRECAQALKATFGNRFFLYGNGWSFADGNHNQSQRDEAAIYRSAKVAISISHYDSDGYFSDRLGRALCSGAMVLSHKYDGIESDWFVGHDLDVFENSSQLIEKCQYWLTSNERESIAYNGFKKAVDILSYDRMVKNILELR